MISERIFIPSPALTFDTAQPNISRLLKLLRKDKTTSILLDLNQVVQCDSAGLAFLIEAKRLSKQHQKPLTITGIPKMIGSLAEFCGVYALLESKW